MESMKIDPKYATLFNSAVEFTATIRGGELIYTLALRQLQAHPLC
jgi:hypothetical protein